MADLLNFTGVRVLDSNAAPGSGYVARFYQSGTTTPVTVYTAEDLGTAHGTSVTADAAGQFAAVWSDGATDVKCVIEDANGATVRTIDPVFRTPSSASAAADIAFAPTVDLPFTDVQAAIEGAAASAASGYATYGIGITGNATLLAALDATNIGAGTYRFDNTTTGTYPTGVAAADTGLIETWRQASGAAMMVLYHATTDRVFHRRMASSTWGTWREVLTVNHGAAEGDTIYRGASAWTRLAKGTAGQILRVNSGATAPEWATSTAPVLLATRTASGGATATMDFTEFANLTYSRYVFVLKGVKPATDAVALTMRTSTNGGSSYDAGASDYQYVADSDKSAGGNTKIESLGATSIFLTTNSASDSVGNAAGDAGICGTVSLFNVVSATKAFVRAMLDYDNPDANLITCVASGKRATAQDTDAVRFLFSSGNVADGSVIEMWGVA